MKELGTLGFDCGPFNLGYTCKLVPFDGPINLIFKNFEKSI